MKIIVHVLFTWNGASSLEQKGLKRATLEVESSNLVGSEITAQKLTNRPATFKSLSQVLKGPVDLSQSFEDQQIGNNTLLRATLDMDRN